MKDNNYLNIKNSRLKLMDIYIMIHLTKTGHTLFFSTQGTYTKIDYLLFHKVILNKFPKSNVKTTFSEKKRQ